MKRSDDQIKKDMQAFVTEILKCTSIEKAIDIDKRLDEYFENNEVPDDLNVILNKGYGEMLRIMLSGR